MAYEGRSANGKTIPAEQFNDIVGLLISLDLVRSNRFDSSIASKGFDGALAKQSKTWDERFQKKFSEIEDHLKEASDYELRLKEIGFRCLRKYRKLHLEHKASMSKIEETFTSKMKLEASKFYWDKKQSDHLVRSNKATTAWWLSLVFGAAALVAVWYGIQSLFGMPKDGAINLTHTLFYGLPVVIYLWILKTYATERKLNLRMADDAEERVAMVKTYLALEVEGKTSAEERFIILNALFRAFASDGDETVPFATVEAIRQATQR